MNILRNRFLNLLKLSSDCIYLFRLIWNSKRTVSVCCSKSIGTWRIPSDLGLISIRFQCAYWRHDVTNIYRKYIYVGNIYIGNIYIDYVGNMMPRGAGKNNSTNCDGDKWLQTPSPPLPLPHTKWLQTTFIDGN